MSKIEVDAITQQSGTTLTVGGGACKTATVDATTVTLGRSGGTVSLAAGATQTGFGRTGTVDWDTTAKTASFTAVSGNGYFVNTTSGAVTVTLPASPSAGDIVSISDYAGTSATNNITIARNGSNFEGGTANGVIETNRQAVTLIYVDATQGWVPTAESDSSFQQSLFVTATGGTITCCGNYKIHTFTGPGTFTVSCAGNPLGSNTVDYLVVAGGGGGGKHQAGGGGAGGYRESVPSPAAWTASPLASPGGALPVSAQGYPIAVGSGGAAGTVNCSGTGSNGVNSTFSTITSTGGGGGGGYTNTPTGDPGENGGSGGGGSSSSQPGGGLSNFGSGNTPPVSPPQGNNGGGGYTPSPHSGGGGGGAGAVGETITVPFCNGGAGGTGVATSITGSSVTRAGGGGGSAEGGPAGGVGGNGGGGAGGRSTTAAAVVGTVNTGGGGGGGASSSVCGAAGGSGIVIIRYKFQ
jgi:hypothetical protein